MECCGTSNVPLKANRSSTLTGCNKSSNGLWPEHCHATHFGTTVLYGTTVLKSAGGTREHGKISELRKHSSNGLSSDRHGPFSFRFSSMKYIPNAPWCWNIYHHLPQTSGNFVGKPMENMGFTMKSTMKSINL